MQIKTIIKIELQLNHHHHHSTVTHNAQEGCAQH